MKLFLPILPIAAALGLCTACSTIICGTHQTIKVRSNPPGATVRADGVYHGTTPSEFELSVKKSHELRIELPGYKPYEMKLERRFNGWVFGNLVFGGLIGVIVDCADGAIYCLLPDEIDARLEPTPASSRGGRRATDTWKQKETLIVATTLKPKIGWKKIGQLERL